MIGLVCAVPTCDQMSRSRGLCEMHYRRLIRTGSTAGHHDDVDFDTTWKDRAACLGAPAAVFFPERGEPTERAKRTCDGCPVRAQCLEYALAMGEKFGIWGGKSERERRAIRRQRRMGREVA